MKEELIQFETAVLAKEKGFNSILNAYYDFKTEELIKDSVHVRQTLASAKGSPYGQNTISDYEAVLGEMDNSMDEFILAPTQSLLQKWLREKHNIIVTPRPFGFIPRKYFVTILKPDETSESFPKHLEYEQALEKGLEEALKLLP